MPVNHLTNISFPNTTNLFIWHLKETSDGATIPAEQGGIVLDRTGALTQADNHLDTPESVFCSFDGINDFLTSTNSAFNFTNSFSTGGWFFHVNWGDLSTPRMIANQQGGSGVGWRLGKSESNTEILIVDTANGGASRVFAHGLSGATWNHFVWTFNASTFALILLSILASSPTAVHSGEFPVELLILRK